MGAGKGRDLFVATLIWMAGVVLLAVTGLAKDVPDWVLLASFLMALVIGMNWNEWR